MKTVDNARWHPTYASMAGSLAACSDAMGLGHSLSWVYGGSGYAFLMNFDDSVCPSHPTAWKKDRCIELCENLGIGLELIWQEDDKGPSDAWDAVRKAVDEGRPAFAWEMSVPEFYVIHGYDESGYYHTGPDAREPTGPYDWHQLGSGMGLWVFVAQPREPKPATTVVMDALRFALELNAEPAKWTFGNRRTGIDGYEAWVGAVRDLAKATYGGKGHGLAYNAAVWAECRWNAVGFLRRAGEAFGDPRVLGEAMGLYEHVAECLTSAADLFPMNRDVWDGNASNGELLAQVADWIAEAKEAEERGLEALSACLSRAA